MQIIKKLDLFLNEAKIRDLILPTQADALSSKWGKKFLDYEEVEPSENINQGKWKLSEEDKNKVLSEFFATDIEEVFDLFDNISDHLSKLIIDSMDINLIPYIAEKVEKVFENFDPKKPTMDQILMMYQENIFRKISINETISNEYIKRDSSGRPEKDDDGNIIKLEKNIGDPIFEKNLVNIKTFISNYNRCYDTVYDFNTSEIRSILDIISNKINDEYIIDYNIFGRDMYLSIRHKPHDILNMSISKFYSSCQHLYSGSYSSQLLANVFDPNSIPAFLIFETPIFNSGKKISNFLPVSRMMIRNILDFDNKDDKVLFFDRAYPDRLKEVFDEMVEKYSNNKKSFGWDDIGNRRYKFTPDLDFDDDISAPYMDAMSLKEYKYIGNNTKNLYLNRRSDWSDVIFLDGVKLDSIVIESNTLPKNMFEAIKNVKWVKFRYMELISLEIFNDIINENLWLDKCSVNDIVIEEINKKKLKKINITSCTLDYTKINGFILDEFIIKAFDNEGFSENNHEPTPNAYCKYCFFEKTSLCPATFQN
jgi:hypothetical protein